MFNSIRVKSVPHNYVCEKAIKRQVFAINESGIAVSKDEDIFIDTRLKYRSMSPVEQIKNGSAPINGAPKVSVSPTLEDVYNAQQILQQFVSSAEAEAKIAEMVAADSKPAEFKPGDSSTTSTTTTTSSTNINNLE